MSEDIRCPKCGSEMIIRPIKKGPNVGRKFYVCIYYPECKGKAAMPFDKDLFLEQWTKDYYLRAEAKQEKLKKLTDDELMELHYSQVVSLAEWAKNAMITGKPRSSKSEKDDLVLNEAVDLEVDRRASIACSSCKNGEPPTRECKKWLDHWERKEEILRCILSEANIPKRKGR